MITILFGENSFEIERATAKIVDAFSGDPERIDGQSIQPWQFPDILMGGTLFADKRLVIIRSLGDNKAAWEALPMWLPRMSDDITLILVEQKIDKRTKAYKQLQKTATIQEYKLWGDRDLAVAEMWSIKEAKALGLLLDKKSAQLLVGRVGLDHWALYRSLEKLAALGEVTLDHIDTYIDSNPTESVFDLFEAALEGKMQRVTNILATLRLQEDPYRLFGLLSGQVFQLAALVTSDRAVAEVAKDIGAHPFAVGKLASYAKKLKRAGVRHIVEDFAEADHGMKTSAADPWLLVERALLKTAASTQ